MPDSSLLSVSHVDHITLVVADLETSAKFYEHVLGMQRVSRPAFTFPGAWLRAGNTLIHMNVAGDEAGQAGLGRKEGTLHARGFHFAFLVEDCHKAAEILRQADISIEVEPRQRPDGAVQLYLRDPDGHLVELFSDPPV